MLSRPLIDRIAFLGISWYAVLIVGAILIGYLLSSREAARRHLPDDLMLDFLIAAIPLSVIGARLYYVLFRLNHFSEDWLSVFDIPGGGLAIFGGVLGGILAARIVSRRSKVSLGVLLDVVAPSLVLGQAIGRWGNYINMEAYGLRVPDEALQFFPFAVEVPIGSVWYWHMATFFYEFCWDLLVFAVLTAFRRRARRDGDVFRWYLLLYCAGRAVIEGLRNDSLTFISDFVRISQVIAALTALGIVISFFLRIRDRLIPANVLPLACAVVSIVCFFLGEFERGAYGFLFFWSQLSMAVLIALQAVFIVLWSLDEGKFDPVVSLPLIADIAVLAVLLIAGIGRGNADNTYYVTLRQCAAMLVCMLSGWVLYRPLNVRMNEASSSEDDGTVYE